MKEIERKFLIDHLPAALKKIDAMEIIQGYLHISEQSEVRIRLKENQYFLTIKSGIGLERNEVEIELTSAQFEKLWPSTAGQRVRKRRYLLPWRDLKLEIDVYDEALQGLNTVEVEFDSVESSQRFSPLSWFGKEVTSDESYKNKNLAKFGIPGL